MEERKYYPCIDLIKFVAAIVIVLHHYYLNTGITQLQMFANGGIIVELFFMISGYLGGISKERIKKITYHRYMHNVIRKIVPMTIITAFTYCFFALWYYLKTGEWYRDAAINFWNIISSLGLIFRGGAIGNISIGVNNPIWYLCVLLICHTFLFMIVKMSYHYPIPVIYGYIIMIFIGFAVITYEYNLPFFNMAVARGYYSFFIGCVIAMLLDNVKDKKQLYVVACCTAIVYLLPRFLKWSFMYENWNLSMPVILFTAIVIVGTIPLSKKYYNISRYLGRISFEIYIWQASFLLIQGLLHVYGIISYNVSSCVGFLTALMIFSMLMSIMFEEKINVAIMCIIEKIAACLIGE